MIDRTKRYLAATGVLSADVDGEEVILNPETGIYHLVNRIGSQVLARMREGQSLEAAVEGIAVGTGEDVDRVREDALSFVQAMIDRGLLEEG